MDETIVRAMEVILRQKISNKIAFSLISSLPIANNDYRLKKVILLRIIEEEISNDCISEKILELIEKVEALDHENGQTASILMKEAFCLVAVDYILLEENKKDMEFVKTFWKNRVSNSIGLVSEMSIKWSNRIDLASKDSSVYEEIFERNTPSEGLRAVKAYLTEAWEWFGPLSLELVAVKARNEVEGLRCGGGGGGGGMTPGNPISELVGFKGTQKANTDTTAMNDVGDSVQTLSSTCPSGTEIIVEGLDEKDVGNVKQATLNEEAGGNLTWHLGIEKNARKRKNSSPAPSGSRREASMLEITRPPDETPEVDKVNEVMSSSPKKPRDVSAEHDSYVTRDSGLEKNAWKQKNSSPVPPGSRRQTKKWTAEEVKTLVKGVERYGFQWKLILDDAEFAPTFRGNSRTNVDLKDKWRGIQNKQSL